MTLREFSDLYNKSRHLSIPEHARPVKIFRENSANELTKSVLAWLEFNNIHAFRQSSEGRFLAPKTVKNVMGKTVSLGQGTYIPRSKGAKGAGDITCTLPPFGRRLEIEIKFGNDRQSDVQKEYQKEVEAMGGIYIIVKSWDGFMYDYKRIMEQQQPISL